MRYLFACLALFLFACGDMLDYDMKYDDDSSLNKLEQTEADAK